MDQILRRAEERVSEAITIAETPRKPKKADLEISSFPVALLLVTATENSFIRRRYALAEAKQADEDLGGETQGKNF